MNAVNGVDLRVPSGTVYGLLGPNGAGKTTIIRMLATVLEPDGGTVRVLGHDAVREGDAVRRRISLTGQYAAVDEDLSGFDNLVLLSRLHGLSWRQARRRAGELLEGFDLTEAANRVVKTYSGGMRRRLDIASSLVVTPDLVFLDEPTTGLDPHSRNQVWDLVRTMVSEGATVLLTTQYLDEADQLADHIAVLDRGRIIAEGTPDDLKRSIGSGVLRIHLRDPEQRPEAERILSDALRFEAYPGSDPRELSVPVSDEDSAMEVLAALSRAGVRTTEFAMGHATLDQVFLTLTGHPTEEPEPKEAL